MPNWCFTEYRCCGKKGELVDLKEKIDHLNSLPEPLVENGFGKLWCGCLVSLLGGDWNEIFCRGEIVDYGFFGCTLNISVMSAWSQLEEWRKFLKTKYPNIQIYYRSEEPSEIIYETNDVDGKSYFPERYILDFLDGPAYFNSLEEAAEYVSGKTGKNVKTEDEITAALDELEEREQEDNGDVFYSFHKFTINEEDEP